MTKDELLEMTDKLFEVLNELYSRDPSGTEKSKLDEQRDKLDDAQRKLVKLIIKEDDAEYVTLTNELAVVNTRIKEDLTDLATLNQTLQNIEQAVGLITQIVALAAAVM